MLDHADSRTPQPDREEGRAGTLGAELIRRSRVYIYRSLVGRGETMAFPIGDAHYEISHDDLVRIIGETTPFLDSPSWLERGAYSTPHPSEALRAALEPYRTA